MTEPWYVRRFDRGYLDLYAHRDAGEAEQVTARILAPLGLEGRRVLDLACGNGRYAIQVAQHEARVVGLDLSASLLEAGRTAGNTPPLGFVRGDMVRLPFRASSFDLVLSMFTSFGYLPAVQDDRAVLNEVARVLAAEGRFVLDFLNAERLRAQLVPTSARTTRRGTVEERRWLDDARGVVVKEMRLQGAAEWDREEVRLWDAPALTAAFDAAGLDVESMHGDYAGGAFVAAESPRLILVARRRRSGTVRVAVRAAWDDLAWGGQPARDAAYGRARAPLTPPTLTDIAACVPSTGAAADFVAAMLQGDEPHRPRWRALQDPEARVVVTGQQPGCAGGPLMVLYKAATAVALARRIAPQLARPVVPVFWNGTDDVDFDEIGRVLWPNSTGEVAAIELPRADRSAESWVGDLDANGDTAALRAVLGAALTERSGSLWPAAARDHGAWVGGFLAAVFPDLLILDARDPVVRRHGAALFARYLARWEEAGGALAEGAAALATAGYRRALSAESAAMGLFLIENHRRVKSRDRDVLRAALERDPESLAPNVLLRALLQDTLLPVVAHVVGPAEFHYLIELRPLRRLLQVHEPALVQRLTATVVDAPFWDGVRATGLAFPAWLVDPEGAFNTAARLEARDAVDAIEARFAAWKFDGLAVEPRGLERAARRLEALRLELEAAAVGAARNRLLQAQPRLEHLAAFVRPRDRAQERMLAAAWWVARTGADGGEALVEIAARHLDDLAQHTPTHAVLMVDTL